MRLRRGQRGLGDDEIRSEASHEPYLSRVQVFDVSRVAVLDFWTPPLFRWFPKWVRPARFTISAAQRVSCAFSVRCRSVSLLCVSARQGYMDGDRTQSQILRFAFLGFEARETN